MNSRFRTEQEALQAVMENSRALRMEQCGWWAMNFVPEHLRTPAACLDAVKRHGMLLEYVPEEFRTEAVCRAAVEADGLALEFVPKALKTAELCRLAVSRNGLAMEFVPRTLYAAIKPRREEDCEAVR